MTRKEAEDKLVELLGLCPDWDDAGHNKRNFNTTWFELNPTDVEKFNKIYGLVADWTDATVTRAGGICQIGTKFRFYTKSVIETRAGIELSVVGAKGCYRIIVRPGYKTSSADNLGLSGGVAFQQLLRQCKKSGFDLRDYAITDGAEVKKTIPKPDIKLYGMHDRVYNHAFHVDINSAYFAGIKRTYGHLGDGKFGEVIQQIYDDRKKTGAQYKYNKSILNASQGYMQSQYCVVNKKGYALAHISKAGIVYCCNKLRTIIDIYTRLGCSLIATNTDGAWFTMPKDPSVTEADLKRYSSDKLGEFKIDHWDCKLRYKSAGAYEFIENGKYYVKLRGYTKLDRTKPRDKWEWGDIYEEGADPVLFSFSKEKGFMLYDNDGIIRDIQ